MTRFRRFLGAVLIAGSSTQCLLFTESPNVQPEVKLDGPDVVRKTLGATFSATVSDDQDPQSAKLHWFVRDQSCPASLSEAMQAPLAATGSTHTVVRGMEGAFCLGVVATDPQGASGFTTRRFEVVNERPVARLRMVTTSAPAAVGNSTPDAPPVVPVPLYSEVRLSGAGSADPDDGQEKLRYHWKVTAPAGVGEPPTCGTGSVVPDGPEICRRLNVPGDYLFELRVEDGQAASELVRLMVIAQPDTLPCFERTEPPHDLARGVDDLPPVVVTAFDRPYTFRVLEVRDDGDAYPTSTGVIPGSFSWWWRLRDAVSPEFDRSTDTTRTSLTIEANSYRPGDELEVRVDYRDRQQEANRCLEQVAPSRCESPPNSGCFQRVSWRLRFIQ